MSSYGSGTLFFSVKLREIRLFRQKLNEIQCNKTVCHLDFIIQSKANPPTLN